VSVTSACEWSGHRDHRMLIQEAIDPAGGVEDAGKLQVGLGD